MNNVKILIDDNMSVDKSLIEYFDIGLVPSLNCKRSAYNRETIDMYRSEFSKYKDYNVIYLTPSKKISNSYMNATVALHNSNLHNIHIIDTKNSLLSMNLLVIYVNHLCYKSKNINVLLKRIDKLCNKVDTKFLTDSSCDIESILGRKSQNLECECASGQMNKDDIKLLHIDRNIYFTMDDLFGILYENINKFDDTLAYVNLSKQLYNNVKYRLKKINYFRNILFNEIDSKDNTLCLSLVKKR